MPELPEVETTKQSLNPILGKKVVKIDVYQSNLRWPVPNNLSILHGYTLHKVVRRAKYLILQFAQHSTNAKDSTTDTKALIVHLGMSGSLQQYPIGTAKRKHDHLIFYMGANYAPDTASLQLHYHDPRRFGSVLWYEEYADKLLNHLGVEPLEDTFTGEYLYNQIHRISQNITLQNNKSIKSTHLSTKPITRPIKSVIMDQAYVVGVGNIYATESLFLAGIHPNTPANLLSQSQLSYLANHIKSILKRAIEQGGSTLRDFTIASGTTGYFQQTLNVYGKHNESCLYCGTQIDKVIINGRASTFCPVCQPKITDEKT